MFALSMPVSDNGTGMRGRLIYAHITGDGQIEYLLAPALHTSVPWSTTEVPVQSYWVSSDRIMDGTKVPCPELPWSALKTLVEDTVTGFTGRLTGFLVGTGFIQGRVQPIGFNQDTMTIHDSHDFDITHLVGDEITDYYPPIA